MGNVQGNELLIYLQMKHISEIGTLKEYRCLGFAFHSKSSLAQLTQNHGRWGELSLLKPLGSGELAQGPKEDWEKGSLCLEVCGAQGSKASVRQTGLPP